MTARLHVELPELVLLADLAALLGRKAQAIYDMRKKGTAPRSITVAGRVYFARQDVLDWLEANREQPPGPPV